MKIGICDDDEIVCREIEKHLRTYAEAEGFEVEITLFASGEALCAALEEEKAMFHLLFIDIELGNVDGVTVGKNLRDNLRNEVTQIVFISYTQKYAMKLFEVRPLDFLIKPITYEKVCKILMVYRRLFPDRKSFFEYKKGKGSCLIVQEEIICVKCEGKKIHLVTVKEEIEFYGKMADAARQLETDKFWTIHKSFIINADYVSVFGKDTIEMVNGNVLPISKTHKKDVMVKILERRKRKLL